MNTRAKVNRTAATALKLAPLSAALLLASCASTPERNPELVSLENRFAMVQSQPYASQQAATELEETQEALEMGRQAYREHEDDALAHYIFVADKTLDIAQERIKLYETNMELSDASDREQELVLAAREQEIAEAESRARSAQAEAEARGAAIAAQQQQLSSQRRELQQKQQELASKEQELTEAQRQLEATKEQARILAQQLTQVTTKVNERGTVLVLSDIVFDFDSAQLKTGSERAIAEIAQFLEQQDTDNIKIEGHTDSVGSDRYNDMLSLERAEAVRNALMQKGVPSNSMSVAGLGEEYPVASNDNGEGRQLNRRVEIIINDQRDNSLATR